MPKFIISHADGSPVDPDARYFVLRVDGVGTSPKRDAARAAVLQFAKLVRGSDPEAAHAAEMVVSGAALWPARADARLPPMKTDPISLPPGVAEAWFHLSAGGEVYVSRVCRGRDILTVLEDLIPMADQCAADLANPDYWHQVEERCVSCSIPCGEDPDIEVAMIDDDRFIAALAALDDIQRRLGEQVKTGSSTRVEEACLGVAINASKTLNRT